MGMKKNILPIIFISLSVAACNRTAPVSDVQYAPGTEFVEYSETTSVDAGPGTSVIKYSVPNDSDLVLETAHHVIQIQGAQNTPYKYYVWAGGKDYADDPDLIVEDGTAAILVEE